MFNIVFDYDCINGTIDGLWADLSKSDEAHRLLPFKYRKDKNDNHWTGVIGVYNGSLLEEDTMFCWRGNKMTGFGSNCVGRFFISAELSDSGMWTGTKNYAIDALFNNCTVSETRKRLRVASAINLSVERVDSKLILRCLKEEDFNIDTVPTLNKRKFYCNNLYSMKRRKKFVVDAQQMEEDEKNKIEFSKNIRACAEMLEQQQIQLKSIVYKQMKCQRMYDKDSPLLKTLDQFIPLFNKIQVSDRDKAIISSSFKKLKQQQRMRVLKELDKRQNSGCPFGITKDAVNFVSLTNDGYILLKRYMDLSQKKA